MDKIDRLLDAMENPERYTSAEIEEMLQDPEIKEVLDLLDKTKSSLQSISTPDAEAEWEKFMTTNRNRKISSRIRFAGFFTRKIAASIAIAIISLTAVAAIVGLSVSYMDRKDSDFAAVRVMPEEAATAASQSDSVVAANDTIMVSAETLIFDNESFATIISEIADYYGYEVIYNTADSKQLRLYYRWKQSLPIEEIVESLNNFGQIHLSLSEKTINVD